jgi:hypothetical protein
MAAKSKSLKKKPEPAESRGDQAESAGENAEKPVSLSPLGFEDALKGVMKSGKSDSAGRDG